MGRKTKEVTITTEGRDKGKMFLLTEMSAWQAEEWGYKALIALQNAGLDVQPSTGMAGLAAQGYEKLNRLSFSELKPLLNEMFECVQRVPDPKTRSVVRALVEDDTEEVMTRVQLRAEVLSLHTGFSFAERLLQRISATPSPASSDTPTSPPASAP